MLLYIVICLCNYNSYFFCCPELNVVHVFLVSKYSMSSKEKGDVLLDSSSAVDWSPQVFVLDSSSAVFFLTVISTSSTSDSKCTPLVFVWHYATCFALAESVQHHAPYSTAHLSLFWLSFPSYIARAASGMGRIGLLLNSIQCFCLLLVPIMA